MIVLVEAEVWYQFITQAAARGIPVVVISGRLTEQKSMRRFRWIMPIARRMFSSLTWVGALAEEHADRFRNARRTGRSDHGNRLDEMGHGPSCRQHSGLRRIGPGNGHRSQPARLGLRQHGGDGRRGDYPRGVRPVGGSDGPELQLMIVPRKPERF